MTDMTEGFGEEAKEMKKIARIEAIMAQGKRKPITNTLRLATQGSAIECRITTFEEDELTATLAFKILLETFGRDGIARYLKNVCDSGLCLRVVFGRRTDVECLHGLNYEKDFQMNKFSYLLEYIETALDFKGDDEQEEDRK